MPFTVKPPFVGLSISYLEPCDWQELSDKFTEAYSFLLERSLERELDYLERYPQTMLNSTSRRDELRAWKRSMDEIRQAKAKLAQQVSSGTPAPSEAGTGNS